MIDIKKALTTPEEVFSTPKAVLQSKELTHEQKVSILRQWAHDLKELEVAEEENMPRRNNKSERQIFLSDVIDALSDMNEHL